MATLSGRPSSLEVNPIYRAPSVRRNATPAILSTSWQYAPYLTPEEMIQTVRDAALPTRHGQPRVMLCHSVALAMERGGRPGGEVAAFRRKCVDNEATRNKKALGFESTWVTPGAKELKVQSSRLLQSPFELLECTPEQRRALAGPEPEPPKCTICGFDNTGTLSLDVINPADRASVNVGFSDGSVRNFRLKTDAQPALEGNFSLRDSTLTRALESASSASIILENSWGKTTESLLISR